MPQKPDRLTPEGEEEEGPFHLHEDPEYDPTKNVQQLISSVKSPKYKSRQVFVELDILKQRSGEYEWRESGRWVKYEESVEEGGKRWSKPHVASLSFHYILELRKCLLDGCVIVDAECYSMSQIADLLVDSWVNAEQLPAMYRQFVKSVMLKGHRHRHQKGRPEDKRRNMKRTNTSEHIQLGSEVSTGGGLTSASSAISLSSQYGSEVSLESMDSDSAVKKLQNERFLRKVPKGAEACSIMVGELDNLDVGLVGLVRLNDAREMINLSSVPLPTRFILYVLGPKGSQVHLREMGRCIATMMVDDIFREVAYKARNTNDFLAGVDEFMEQVTVLPPGEWDPKIRIEPPDRVPSQDTRKTESLAELMAKKHGANDEHENHDDPDLQLTLKPFNGLYYDVKRKAPFFLSDFKDAIHIQCIPAMLFIFLATLTNNVTFGALLGQGTGNYMGVMECVFAGAVSMIIFALFSGQPLNILGSTGPMLVLEQIIFDLCQDNDWDFLSARFWVGIWTTAFLLLMVVFNLSALVRYITRFTEECFACLIAIIFIVESFSKLQEIANNDPIRRHAEPDKVYFPSCHCAVKPDPNATLTTTAMTSFSSVTATSGPSATTTELVINGWTFANASQAACEEQLDGLWVCRNAYVADAFLMSLILFFLTFGITLFLKAFRNWPCFPSFIRTTIGDFAILIGILVCVGIDAAVGIPTPKLLVPNEFKPTRSEDREWIVTPISPKNPWWLYIAAGLPALLATILIFMDQQITAVIVNRKEHKLVKGKGYHLDLLIVSLLVALHSILGLPWYVAATVHAVAHINSLKKESECTAPGERPTFLGCREQRVTAMFVGILSAAAVFITAILKYIPMPVLYGVFFYMGYSALGGMQLIDRILLMLMPIKYQPDYIYLRHVPLWRVHLFTCLQVLCVAALWIVKSIKSISIIFPLLVVFTAVVRKFCEWLFTQRELMYIDGLLPGKHAEDEHKKTDSEVPDEKSTFTSVSDKGLENGTKPCFFIQDDQDRKHGQVNNGFDNTKL